MDYLLSNPIGNVDMKAFEMSCGVGIVVSPEQIEQEVERVIKKNHAELVEKRSVAGTRIIFIFTHNEFLHFLHLIRYRFNVGPLMSEVRNNLKWADGKVIKSEIEIQVLSLLGPKTEEDLAPPKVEKIAKPKAPKPTSGTKENLGKMALL